jgi:hypothetical protein
MTFRQHMHHYSFRRVFLVTDIHDFRRLSICCSDHIVQQSTISCDVTRLWRLQLLLAYSGNDEYQNFRCLDASFQRLYYMTVIRKMKHYLFIDPAFPRSDRLPTESNWHQRIENRTPSPKMKTKVTQRRYDSLQNFVPSKSAHLRYRQIRPHTPRMVSMLKRCDP